MQFLAVALFISDCDQSYQHVSLMDEGNWKCFVKMNSAAALRETFISPLQIYAQIFSMTKEWTPNPTGAPYKPASAKIIQLTSIFSSHHNSLSCCLLFCLVPAKSICLFLGEGTWVKIE